MTIRHAFGLLVATWLLAGCASLRRRGRPRLLAHSDGPAEDTRMCEVSGPAFAGILPMLERQAGYPPLGQAGPERPILKVIMVHGVGTHVPGHSARLSANLARSLGLSVVAPEAKAFPIETPGFPGETLGKLTVTRHTNTARDREMLFFELTWSPISQPAKDAIAFDSTAVYAHRRASLNNVFKQFVNDVAPDPLVYTGTGRERIQATIGQTLCWALSADWQGLPDDAAALHPRQSGLRLAPRHRRVRLHHPQSRQPDHDRRPDPPDAGRRDGRRGAPRGPAGDAVVPRARRQDLHARQPAAPAPERPGARGASRARCRLIACRRALTSPIVLFQETELIAFSDPNDLLSYPIPDAFVRDYVDSRLCPKQVNVTINIARVRSVLGFGDFANPLAAHVDYDDDERVIGLITRGIGQPETAPVVKERCTWLEVGEDLR